MKQQICDLPRPRSARWWQSARPSSRVKPIESITVADLVWAWDPDRQLRVKRPVRRLFRREREVTLHVGLCCCTSGVVQALRATTEHPLWVEGRGWTAASKLAAGDRLKAFDGSAQVVLCVSLAEPAPVFNFEVEGVRNYFVGTAGVLVHNRSTRDDPTQPDGPQRRSDSWLQAAQALEDGPGQGDLYAGYLRSVAKPQLAKLAQSHADVEARAGRPMPKVFHLGDLDPSREWKGAYKRASLLVDMPGHILLAPHGERPTNFSTKFLAASEVENAEWLAGKGVNSLWSRTVLFRNERQELTTAKIMQFLPNTRTLKPNQPIRALFNMRHTAGEAFDQLIPASSHAELSVLRALSTVKSQDLSLLAQAFAVGAVAFDAEHGLIYTDPPAEAHFGPVRTLVHKFRREIVAQEREHGLLEKQQLYKVREMSKTHGSIDFQGPRNVGRIEVDDSMGIAAIGSRVPGLGNINFIPPEGLYWARVADLWVDNALTLVDAHRMLVSVPADID